MSWQTRKSDLRGIKRYERFPVMFYRTNLHLHTNRVKALLKSMAKEVRKIYPELDLKKAALIATHHDDHELITGDIPLQLKLLMNGNELYHLKNEEISAAEAMARIYPKKIKGYNYLDIALHAICKDCPEAQLVSVIDKCDGYCEAVHEVLAGNNVFLEPVINYNIKIFDCLAETYPLIEKMFSTDLLSLSALVEIFDFFEGGKRQARPHSTETIERNSGIPVYEWWKSVTIKNFGINPLILQTEFFPQPTRRILEEGPQIFTRKGA